MRKWKVFDSSKRRLALYSSLISHFCHFRKIPKNRCRNGHQNHRKLVQNPTWRRPVAIDSSIFVVLERCKKHVFLIRFPWPKKCEKSDQQAGQGFTAVKADYFLGAWPPRAAPFHARAYHGKRKNGSLPVRTGKR